MNDTDSSEICVDESSNRKRPCSEDLNETDLESSTEKDVQITEQSDPLANKKPRFVRTTVFMYLIISNYVYINNCYRLSEDEYQKLKQQLRDRS